MASQVGDLGRVRKCAEVMLRSRANTLVGVRRVTELNAGRKTPAWTGRRHDAGPGTKQVTGPVGLPRPAAACSSAVVSTT